MIRTSLRPYIWIGWGIAVLLVITAGAGLLVEGFYDPFFESEALLIGLPVQDLVSLIAAPLLLAAMIATRRGSVRALVLWSGLLLYVGYYYAFYSFGYLYTVVYPLYLALMGLATYSLIGLLARVDLEAFARQVDERMPVRFIAFVLGMAVLFVPIWLIRLGQGIRLQQVGEADLVFVLDLAFLIPAMAFTAVQVWRRQPVGFLLSGVLLVKSVISGVLLTGGSLRQIQYGYAVAPEELSIYIFLAVAGAAGLALYLRHLHEAPVEAERGTARAHRANTPEQPASVDRRK